MNLPAAIPPADLPMMGTTIELDGVAVVRDGVLQDVFG
jgi:2,5-dihydroxypyridine 5,6-dioxygenase